MSKLKKGKAVQGYDLAEKKKDRIDSCLNGNCAKLPLPFFHFVVVFIFIIAVTSLSLVSVCEGSRFEVALKAKNDNKW